VTVLPPKKVVVLGLMSHMPVAGVAWVTAHYLVVTDDARARQKFWDSLFLWIVDIRDELWNWGERLDAPVYPRLDAHWADEGGLSMARALAETIEPGVTDAWVVDAAESWSVPADLPPMAGRSGDAEGRYYTVLPDGSHEATQDIKESFREPLAISSKENEGKVSKKVGLLADSFTIRSLRYLAAAFSDMTVLHYGSVLDDQGVAAAQMLAEHDVVAFEVVERILVPSDSTLTNSRVVDTIINELSKHPVR
jgi:hypothetical protein